MMDESELRRRFAQLREAEQASAPSFARTYGRAHTRRGWRGPIHAWPLVIGVAATVAIALVWRVSERSISPSAVAPTIATWRAPTDVFLRTPGSELLRAIPALGASVLDTIIPAPTKRGA